MTLTPDQSLNYSRSPLSLPPIKKNFMKRILILCIALVFLSCKDDEVPANPWDAEQLVQMIASGKDWEKEYSDANISTETKFLDQYNAERTIKTLYPETDDELVVIYDGDKAQELYWYKSGQWTTPYGTVGDPITVIENANEAPIQFYGLGYDQPGKIKIDSGKLADKKITFAARPTSDLIPSEYYSNASFNASTEEALALKLYIIRVEMKIPETPTTEE